MGLAFGNGEVSGSRINCRVWVTRGWRVARVIRTRWDGARVAMTKQRNDHDVVPDSHRDLLEQPLTAHLATLRPDGLPQSNSSGWSGTAIISRSAQKKARQKMRNIDHDPHVAVSVTDPENPYRSLEVRGEVDRVEDDKGRSFIDHLSERYMGERRYPHHQPGDERVVVYIRPLDSSSMAA